MLFHHRGVSNLFRVPLTLPIREFNHKTLSGIRATSNISRNSEVAVNEETLIAESKVLGRVF